MRNQIRPKGLLPGLDPGPSLGKPYRSQFEPVGTYS